MGKNTQEKLHEGTVSTYFCDTVNIAAITYGQDFKVSYGMQTCINEEDPTGDNIIDENFGLFSMDLSTNGL